MRLKRIMRQISLILTASMLNLCWMTSYGWAEMVKTQEIPPQITREMLIDALNREDVQKQLEQYGVSQVEAVARINSLTDEEISALVAQIGSIPSGGSWIGIHGGEFSGDDGLTFWLAVSLLIYPMMVLTKGIGCIFSDCAEKGGASYIFKFHALWIDDDIYLLRQEGGGNVNGTDEDYDDYEGTSGGNVYETDENYDQEDSHTGNTYPTDELENKDCDPGWESCT